MKIGDADSTIDQYIQRWPDDVKCVLTELRAPGKDPAGTMRPRYYREDDMNRLAGVLTIVVLTSGCSLIASVVGESIGYPLEDKAVSSKLEPNVLVAVDGSSCEVSKERWEKAKVGEFFLCNWSSGS